MKQKLTAGAELDLLTQEELEATVQGIVSGFRRPTTPWRDVSGSTGVASGDIQVTLSLPVKPGYELVLVRLVLDAPGSAFTPAAPYTAAGSYSNLLRSTTNAVVGQGEVLDFASNVSGGPGAPGIPQRWLFGDSFGPRFREGEILAVFVHLPPASTALRLLGEGYLSPLVPDEGAIGQIIPS
jgi:hypothetical protein